ncbi:hypothetical protein BH23GEM10_BH23GEM10_17330 [soil metagenome]
MTAQRIVLTAALSAVLPLAGSAPASAQDGFLLGAPSMSATFRVGPVMHRAQSQVFDFIVSELTLERDDFTAPSLGVEVTYAAHPRLDLSLGVAWAQTETQSEFREFIDEDDQPIEQVTRLRTVPLSASARVYPFSRGRAVSSLAWLPTRTTPYIGAGIDLVGYKLQQVGDFVAVDYTISAQDYQSTGSATTLHARLGVDHWFSPKVGLNLEGRYTHGSAQLDGDFRAHERLDLRGINAGMGLTVRW